MLVLPRLSLLCPVHFAWRNLLAHDGCNSTSFQARLSIRLTQRENHFYSLPNSIRGNPLLVNCARSTMCQRCANAALARAELVRGYHPLATPSSHHHVTFYSEQVWLGNVIEPSRPTDVVAWTISMAWGEACNAEVSDMAFLPSDMNSP